MVEIESYMQRLLDRLRQEFGGRLVYVGLQGSYLRGEAGPSSDIDVMMVLDTLHIEDLDRYREIISGMPEPEKACGFLCGRDELAAWQPYEIFHLVQGTKDYYGTLRDLVPAYTRQDIVGFVKICAGNLYHELCHRYVFEDAAQNKSCFPATCKQVFYLLQAAHYLRTGHYAATKQALLDDTSGIDKEVLQLSIDLKNGGSFDFSSAFALVFGWCRGILKENF